MSTQEQPTDGQPLKSTDACRPAARKRHHETPVNAQQAPSASAPRLDASIEPVEDDDAYANVPCTD